MRKPGMFIAAALAALLISPLAAEAGRKAEMRKQTPEDQIYDQHALGVRYPGDVATPVGNYHVRGGKKIPYIERCHWVFFPNGGNLLRPTQVCRRYYGKPLD